MACQDLDLGEKSCVASILSVKLCLWSTWISSIPGNFSLAKAEVVVQLIMYLPCPCLELIFEKGGYDGVYL